MTKICGAVLAVLIADSALAHSWYPLDCCSGKDCAWISDRLVEITPGGYRVTLRPGDHPMVKAPVTHFVEYRKARPSPDGAYHICLAPGGATFLCLFAPPMGL